MDERIVARMKGALQDLRNQDRKPSLAGSNASTEKIGDIESPKIRN